MIDNMLLKNIFSINLKQFIFRIISFLILFVRYCSLKTDSKHKYWHKLFELSMDENGYYQPSKRVWKTVESWGKVSEKSGNVEIHIEWQPCHILGTRKVMILSLM